MASRRRSWLTTASARKSSISLPRKTMRSRRRRPMTSPAPAPPPAASDSARHRGACGASEAQGLRLRSAPCCGRCEGAQARARAHGRLTRRAAAAAAATERDAVALALPAAITTELDCSSGSGSGGGEQSRGEEMDNTQHPLLLAQQHCRRRRPCVAWA